MTAKLSAGEVWASAGSILQWPLPWPARAIISIRHDDSVFYCDVYGTGVCNARSFMKRAAQQKIVLIGHVGLDIIKAAVVHARDVDATTPQLPGESMLNWMRRIDRRLAALEKR